MTATTVGSCDSEKVQICVLLKGEDVAVCTPPETAHEMNDYMNSNAPRPEIMPWKRLPIPTLHKLQEVWIMD